MVQLDQVNLAIERVTAEVENVINHKIYKIADELMKGEEPFEFIVAQLLYEITETKDQERLISLAGQLREMNVEIRVEQGRSEIPEQDGTIFKASIPIPKVSVVRVVKETLGEA